MNKGLVCNFDIDKKIFWNRYPEISGYIIPVLLKGGMSILGGIFLCSQDDLIY